MRRRSFLACGLTLLAAMPASALASDPGTGGTSAPPAGGPAADDRPVFKQRVKPPPVATRFTVNPATLTAGGPATFRFRIDGRSRQVRVRIELTRRGAPAPAKRLRLGYRATGVRHTFAWTPATGELPAADYTVTLHAFDDIGRGLRRTARASGRGRLTVAVAAPPIPAATGRFPVQGAYSFGGAEARFGARRHGHLHQGQDIAAAEGTPLVAPMAASVTWVAFQAKGAGHYVVLRGADGRDYVFMHLAAGSIVVEKGAALKAGQTFARVGSTGGSSGPHLHFEIWPDGWFSSKASRPIDPLPQLMAWLPTR